MLLLIELVVWALFCTVFISYEKGWGAFWATVGVGVALWLTGGINVLQYAYQNPLVVAQGLAGWMVVGFVWATVKFIAKLRKASSMYSADKADYLTTNASHTAQDFIDKIGRYEKEKYAPTVNANKGNIMFWAWWWPFSMISFICADMIREVWNMSWRVIKSFFEKIRASVLGEAARDLD